MTGFPTSNFLLTHSICVLQFWTIVQYMSLWIFIQINLSSNNYWQTAANVNLPAVTRIKTLKKKVQAQLLKVRVIQSIYCCYSVGEIRVMLHCSLTLCYKSWKNSNWNHDWQPNQISIIRIARPNHGVFRYSNPINFQHVFCYEHSIRSIQYFWTKVNRVLFAVLLPLFKNSRYIHKFHNGEIESFSNDLKNF